MSRNRKGLMEVVDATHCVYMAEGITVCPTCGEDLGYKTKGGINN